MANIRRRSIVGILAALLLGSFIAPGAMTALSLPDHYQDTTGGMHCVNATASLCHRGLALNVRIGSAGRLTDVALFLDRTSGTTADLAIELHDRTPDGTLLATSDPVPASDIPTSQGEWINFTFADPPWFEVGDEVAIVILATLDSADEWGVGVGADEWNMWTNDAGFWDGWPAGVAYATYIQRPVDRLAGADRYATAAAISEWNYPLDVPLVYIATGSSFPDALSGAAAAGHTGAPLLLVPGSGANVPAVVATELGYLDPDRIVVLGGTGAVSPAIATKLKNYAPTVVRVSGSDRYATAVAISKDSYPAGDVSTVFVATGLAFPDALAAAAQAGREGAPLLLVPGNALNLAGVPGVVAELQRLSPDEIVIAGGTGAVSAGIESDLAATFGGADVTRLSGTNRYATAAAISAASNPDGPTPIVYVATGRNFPDALAGAALAGRDGAPLLLVNGVSQDLGGPEVQLELTRLKAQQIVIFGGPGAVTDQVASRLRQQFVWP